MQRLSVVVPALGLATCLASPSVQAADFVCTAVPPSSDADRPPLTQVWNQRCIPYWITDNGGFLLEPEFETLVQESFEVWSNPTCNDLNFRYTGATSQGAEFDPDSSSNQNVVATTASRAESEELFGIGDGLLAITLTSFSLDTGEIFDADIVLNAAVFSFANIEDPSTCVSSLEVFDLQNVLVHEIGHFIGFDHVDDAEATMFESALPCETLKRDLAAVDLDGVCSVYPAGRGPMTCDPADDYGSGGFLSRFRNQCDDGGCRCTGATAQRTQPYWVLVLAGLLFALRRRACSA